MNPMAPMPNNLPSLLHLDMSVPAGNNMINGINRPGAAGPGQGAAQMNNMNAGMGMNPQQLQQMMAMGLVPPGMEGMMGMHGGGGAVGGIQQGQMPQAMGQGQNMRQTPSKLPTPILKAVP
jgi:hypothetical protein